MREQHSSYYLEQSLMSFNALMNLDPPGDWGIRFKPEADNFRSAWAWTIDNDLKSALGFASTFSLDWSQVVPLIEIHRIQKTALDLAKSDRHFSAKDAPEEDRRLLSGASISTSRLAFATRQIHLAIEFAERSASISEEIARRG